MFDLLVILFISFGLLLAAYSIRNVFKAMKFLRFSMLWQTLGLGFIASITVAVGILFLYLGGILNEYGWVIFICPSIVGALFIRAVYILRRRLHAG